MQWRDNDLIAWLCPILADLGGYRHVRLIEDVAGRPPGLEALARLVERAHEDAKTYLEDLLAIPLDPLGEDDVADAYPDALNTLTLQGYLGEILAGVVAENYGPHDVEWEVPAFLFRFSNAALEGLDRRLQVGGEATRTPGRTGDDCFAFLRDPNGRIVAWLNCEAKCSSDHNAGLIREGHAQLSRAQVRPVSAYQLIDVLRDSELPDADAWIAALRLFRRDAMRAEPPERADMLVYVCGRAPVQRESWIPCEAPHDAYRGGRPLEAVEVHFSAFDDVLTTVYPTHQVNRA